jgi:hypothetical protein
VHSPLQIEVAQFDDLERRSVVPQKSRYRAPNSVNIQPNPYWRCFGSVPATAGLS